ncbi:uncharacterized protein TA04495 [Theileria annulata]|uniref:Cytosolic Fe-S cluster assembly factor NUBP1 homolog n=1 Tax=Theileria annulata TaxID=5874 RepID=Q4UC14_THEAN|nr:uncharacterized protein TA04495 [Theileria annulata]CAI75637.1 hypothetical protein, conserved [Theileria annulata]|eukprot:XP_955113.1 hypothetical protein, conserved [Theileria annulata]
MKQESKESFWNNLLKFISNHSTEIKIIAFITAYHYLIKYSSKFSNTFSFFSKRDDIPESCPGPGTQYAGLSKSCEGCPNKSSCSSNNPSNSLNSNTPNSLTDVHNIVVIASGKGGVGKSTVAVQLSYSLERLGKRVGLLDIDITGPSVPAMTNTRHSEVFESLLGWSPIYVTDRMCVMSIGYLMSNDEHCISWRGAKKDALIKKFLTSVNWGELDYLVVDTPPGTSDEHITFINTVKLLRGVDKGGLMGVLVTTPQKRAIDDVKRSAKFCADVGIDIVMLVENMTNSFLDSTEQTDIPDVTSVNELKDLCEKYKISKHVTIESDPKITQAGELGQFYHQNDTFLNLAETLLTL